MDFLLTLLGAGLIISLIMLCLLGLSSFSRKTLNAKTRYFMWIILLLGLIVPFRPLLGTGIIQLAHPFSNSIETNKLREDGSEIRNEARGDALSTNPSSIVAAEDQERRGGFGLAEILITVWAIGVAFSLARHLTEYLRFQRIVKRWAKPLEDAYTLETFEFVKARMGLENRKIGILSVATVSTPMLTGLLNPVVLIPEKPIEDDEMELILEHELTHYKHKDLWVNLLSVCALSIHWFNPILYLCMPMIYGDGESYCDEEVLRNKNVDYRRFYGEVIISMIEVSPQKHSSLSTCFYAKKLNIKKRLFNIMESHGSHKKLSLLSVALVFCLTLFSGSVIVFGARGAGDAFEAKGQGAAPSERDAGDALGAEGKGEDASPADPSEDGSFAERSAEDAEANPGALRPADVAGERGASGAGQSPIAGAGRKGASGAEEGADAGRKDAGGAEQSAGAGRKGASDAEESAGAGRKGASDAEESAGAGRKGASDAEESAGAGRKAAGGAEESAGAGKKDTNEPQAERETPRDTDSKTEKKESSASTKDRDEDPDDEADESDDNDEANEADENDNDSDSDND